MDSGKETDWYAVQTRLYHETRAAGSVSKLDVEVFLPKIQQEQPVCGAWRTVTKPLFPGYFFARFCPLISLEAVRHAHGIIRVVGTSRVPIPIERTIIESLQERVQGDGFIWAEPRTFQPGDKVAIEQGPLRGWMGRVERESDDRKRILILLEAMEQASVLIDQRWLAAAGTG